MLKNLLVLQGSRKSLSFWKKTFANSKLNIFAKIKFHLQQKIQCVFVDASERTALLSRQKIDIKEDITL